MKINLIPCDRIGCNKVRKIEVSSWKDGVLIYKRERKLYAWNGHVKLGLCMRYQSGDAE